jgi:hypothetical protein
MNLLFQVISGCSIPNVYNDPFDTLLGPHSVIDYVTIWKRGSITGNFTTMFHDPTRQVAAVYSVGVEADPIQHNVRTELLTTPLRPGWWTIRYYDKPGEFSEPFLVLPLSVHNGKPIRRATQAQRLHGGPTGGYLSGDYGIPTQMGMGSHKSRAELNARKTGEALLEWIDELLRGQWAVNSVCHPESSPQPHWMDTCLCEETSWSSYRRDMKSTIA